MANVEREYAVYLTPDEWEVVSNCLLIVDEERNGKLGQPEELIQRKIVDKLERQGVMLHRG